MAVVLLTFRTSGTARAAKQAREVGAGLDDASKKVADGARKMSTFATGISSITDKIFPFDTGVGKIAKRLQDFATGLASGERTLPAWQRGLMKAADGVRAVGSKIATKFGEGIKAAATGIVATAAGALGTALVKGLGRLKALDQATNKLDGLGHSAETVDQIMKDSLASVKGTAFGMDDAATVAASAVAAGIKPGQELERTLKLVADASTIAGTDMGSMGAIFNKVAASNKVQMDVINQLHDAGVPALASLADHMGVTAEEASKMASRGEIDFATFQAAMEGALGGAAASSGNTFSGAMANVMASLGRIGAGILGGVFPKLAPLFQSLTTALGPLEDKAAQIGELIGSKLAPVIEWLTDALSGGLGEFKIAPQIIAPLTAAFLALGSSGLGPLIGMIPGLRRFGGALGGLAGGPFLAVAAFAGLVAVSPELREALGTLLSAVTAAGSELAPVLAEVGELISSALVSAIEIAVPVISTIVTALADFITWMTESGALVDSLTVILGVGVGAWVAFKVAVAGISFANFLFGIGAATVAKTKDIAVTTAIVALYAKDLVISLAKGAASIAATTAGWVASTAAQVASRVALVAGTVATGAATAAQWAFNAALNASPLMWIVTAIGAVVAALVWFFTQTELGQQIWSSVMDAIGTAATWVWESILKPVFGAIGDWFEATVERVRLGVDLVRNFFRFWGAVAVWLWENAIQPVLGWIGEKFTEVTAWIGEKVELIKLGLELFGQVVVALWQVYVQPALDQIGAAFLWLWEFGIKPVIDFVIAGFRFWGEGFVWLYESVILPVGDWIRGVFDNIGLALSLLGFAFTFVYEQYIKPAWERVGQLLLAGWNFVDEHVFAPFGRGIDLLVEGFKIGASAIGTAWEGIKSAAAIPINFVLGTIWNDGLRSFWNDVVTELGLEDMKLKKAPLIKFADGTENHVAQIAPAGAMRLWAEPETGGEAYIPLADAKRGRSTAILADVADRFGYSLTAYADGGVDAGASGNWFTDTWDNIASFGGDVLDNIRGAAEAAWGFVTDPIGSVQRSIIDGIIKPLLGDDGNVFLRTVGQLPINIAKGLGEKVADFFGGMGGGEPSDLAPQGGAGMGWQAMWRIVQGAIPGAVMTSNYRPGSITVNGGQSYHALGRAIDLIPATMDTFNKVAALFPSARELIFSPAGGRQLLNGQPHFWGGAVRAQHWDHVHVAMRDGGVLPMLARGGPVKKGEEYIVGDGGRPELFVPGADGYVYPSVPATPGYSDADIDASLDELDVQVGPRGDRTIVRVVTIDGKVLLEEVFDEAADEEARL